MTDMNARPVAAIILAAGKGTRMRSATHKVLHAIGGLPMLRHLMATLDALQPERTVVVVGDRAEQVESALAGFPATIAVQQPQRGTGHAVQQAEAALAGFLGDVLILFGDAPLVSARTMALLLERLRSGATLAVLAFEPDEPGAYGRVILNADGGVDAMVEAKDATPDQLAVRLCNAGIMAVRSEALFGLLAQVTDDNAAGEYYLPDIVGLALNAGGRAAIVTASADEVAGVNSRADLAAVEAMFQRRRRAEMMDAGVTLVAPDTVFFAADTRLAEDVTVEPYVVFGPGVVVARGTTIHSHSHIEGATIGENCAVGPFARLRPGTVLGAGAKIGNFVETKKTVLGDGAKANHLTYLGDATVGANANIGAGTITCNYDGFGKYPTIIGEDAFIGSNSALVAPVTIGDGAIVGAGSVITSDVEAGALATARGVLQQKPGWATRFRAAKLAKKKVR